MAIATDNTHKNSDDAVRNTMSTVADKAANIANKAGMHLDHAIDNAEAVARNVSDHSRDAGERVNEIAGNLKSAVDKSVKEQPIATLVVAAALGFVIGAIWKS